MGERPQESLLPIMTELHMYLLAGLAHEDHE